MAYPCYLLPFLCLGASSLSPDQAVVPPSAAQRAWELGELALGRDDVAEGIRQFQASLRLDPGLAESQLGLGLAYLHLGEDENAAAHLTRYLSARPDHLIVRIHLAEALLRLYQLEAACAHFERFAAEAQDHPQLAAEHLVRTHSRLMEIAQAKGDAYAEHLNRGIGLYRLAIKRAAVPGASALSAEPLLFQAAAELVLARRAQPDEARPCWYLYRVWSRLDQRQPSLRWLRTAAAVAPFGSLTAAERRDLHLTCQQCLADERRK